MSEFVEVKPKDNPEHPILVTLEEAEEMQEEGLLIPEVTTPSSQDVLTLTDVFGPDYE